MGTADDTRVISCFRAIVPSSPITSFVFIEFICFRLFLFNYSPEFYLITSPNFYQISGSHPPIPTTLISLSLISHTPNLQFSRSYLPPSDDPTPYSSSPCLYYFAPSNDSILISHPLLLIFLTSHTPTTQPSTPHLPLSAPYLPHSRCHLPPSPLLISHPLLISQRLLLISHAHGPILPRPTIVSSTTYLPPSTYLPPFTPHLSHS